MGLQVAAGLMMAQQIAGKAARDGLFLQHFGPPALPLMVAGAAGFSVLLSLLSGRLMFHAAPRAVVPWALGASGLLQLGERWLLGFRPGLASVLIYLHMAGLGAILLSLFWSMLNEEFDPREAKRRFGQIAAGGTIGGLLGGLAAERTVAWFGAPLLMLWLGTLHLLCGGFLAVLTGKTNRPRREPPRAALTPAEALKAISRSSLLLTLGIVVLLGSVGAALLDYVFKVYATEAWGRGSDLLRFFAFFHAGVALLSFFMQSTAARVFLQKFGLGKTVLTLPGTLVGGSFLALLIPGAVVAAAARAAEAAVRGSLFRAVYETCYTPVPAAEKRLAKTFIDVGSERGGDAVGAAIVLLCIKMAHDSALTWILGIAALVGLVSIIVCRTLDRIYLKALAQSLVSRAVHISLDSDMDLTTKSLVLRTGVLPLPGKWPPDAGSETPRTDEAAIKAISTDPVLNILVELRSTDPGQVQTALISCDASDPVIAAQVCLLLGNSEYALLAHSALFRAPGKVLGLMTDLMMNPAVDVAARRRIPRIIATVPGQRAADALMAGLEDSRFEVRLQCARALVKAVEHQSHPVVQPEKIMAAVDRELSIGKLLWETHRRQHDDPNESSEWLDELLLGKAHGSLEYVFTLLSLLYERKPLMTAFRSLHLEDKYLRGTALEYLEGILPAKTREMLWEIIQERPSESAGRKVGEVMEELMHSSETVVLRLRDLHPPHNK